MINKPDNMRFTGERFVPEVHGEIELEHWHRYLQASQIAPGKVILDIACGEGYGAALLAQSATRVIGVDISDEAVQHASRRYRRENLEYLSGSCADIPIPDASVDMVVSFETIEHHDQHERMMREIKRVLKPDGVLIISSPDKYFFSEVPGTSNPYHVKELYEHEFKGLIGGFFRNVTYFTQRIVYGSGMLAESQASHVLNYWQENGVVGNGRGLVNPVYWIALASDAQLPVLAASVYEPLINVSKIIQDLYVTLAEKDARIVNLKKTLLERDARISTLEKN